jgi:DNA mismatch repair protein MutS2
VGDRVRLVSLKLEGVITSLSEVDAEVQVGNLRIRVHLNELQRPHPVEEPQNLPVQRQASPAANPPFRASPGMEIDLRGQRAEDAVEALDRYLENAFLAGMPFVRIIHGKGTGKLRQVIREALAQSPHVSRFESGADAEGGDGEPLPISNDASAPKRKGRQCHSLRHHRPLSLMCRLPVTCTLLAIS